MVEFDKIQEDVEVGVKEQSLQIPVRVTVSSLNNAPLEFTSSIDDLGQIVLTPVSKEVTFITANTNDTVEYETPIMDQQDIITDETNNYIEKETSILINATMLVDTNATTTVGADIDEIGQCVIYPMNKENVFTTATIDNSLNLITEDVELHNYCDGYKLINPGGNWYVKDPSGRLIGQDFDSVNAAKIFVCETEIDRLRNLEEDVAEEGQSETSEEETAENSEQDVKVPTDVEAEVITEAVVAEPAKVNEFSGFELEKALTEITNNYTDVDGGIRCDTEDEQRTCEELLKQHYNSVAIDTDGSKFIVMYSELKENKLNESVDESEKMKILVRFLQGDITLVSDPVGEPKESYILLTSENNSDYYYDPETDVIGVYKR